MLQNQLSGTDQIAALWRCDQFREAELEILATIGRVIRMI